MKYVLDTNIFNRLLDGKLSVRDLPSDGAFVATTVQRDELLKTPDPARRALLISTLSEFVPKLTPTSSFALDVSRFDQSRWSDGKRFNDLKGALDSLKKKKNNTQDALIAEVALVEGFVLLTSDKNLAQVAEDYGVKVKLFP